ncbi:MAG: PAS domain-containing protein [Beijerinckiaceae bacterium]|nr:PAS domain-containing protein [Beijerinckiaceae bacterium]
MYQQFSRSVVEVDVIDPRELDDTFERVITQRLGVLPHVYRRVGSRDRFDDRGALWAFAKRSYLDNPLPSLFKERAFIHLSRLTRVRYCLARHSGYLIGKGYPAGDRSAQPQAITELLALLGQPLPDGEAVEAAVARLAAIEAPLGIPEPGSLREKELFAVLSALFIDPPRWRQHAEWLARVFGNASLDALRALLAYVKAEHFWAESHPDVDFEPDIAALLQQSPEFAQRLFGDEPAATLIPDAAMRGMLAEMKRTRDALDGLQDRNAFLLKLGDGLRPLSDPEPVQREASRLLRDFLRADQAHFAEIDELTESIRIVDDRMGEGVAVSPDRAIAPIRAAIGELRTGATIVINDVSRFSRFDPDGKRLCFENGIRSLVCVPILKDGSLIAALSVASYGPRRWTSQDVALIEDVAERVSSAIERAHAEQKLKLREAELARVQEISNVGGIDVDVASGFLGRRSPEYRRIHGLPDHVRYESHASWLSRVHPEDREQADRTFQEAMAGTAAIYESEYRIIRQSDGATRWIYAKIDIERGADGRPTRLVGAHTDITDRKLGEEAVRDSEHRLRILMEGIPQLVWRSRDDGEWTWASPQWQSFTGQSVAEAMGLGWLEAVHPDDRPTAREAWTRAAEVSVLDVEYRVRRASDGAYLWHHTRSTPVRDEAGNIIEWLGTKTDVQQMKELQENQALLVAELQHRTRNLIAVVRAIAQQTMTITGPTPAFQEQFGRRLAALARVQSLLSRSEEEPITIDALVRLELEAIGGQAGVPKGADISGPPIRIRHSIVQTLALALHELATNACKYGALAAEGGSLSVTWSIVNAAEENTYVRLVWLEYGPALSEASRDAMQGGYGRQLIERALPYTLHARTQYELSENGVRCEIEIPIAKEKRRPE